MGESRPRVGWSRVPRCPVAHRKWGHRQQPAASRGAPATAPSPPPWAWAGRTGCVPWDCPRTGKREGDLCDPTRTGRRWGAPPYPWGPAFLGAESAAPAPRPPPSTLPSLSRPRTLRGGCRTCVAFLRNGAQSLASGAALPGRVPMSAMSFEVLPGRPVGGVFPHTASEWGVVSLSLLGAPAFWNVSRFFGTEGHRSLPWDWRG